MNLEKSVHVRYVLQRIWQILHRDFLFISDRKLKHPLHQINSSSGGHCCTYLHHKFFIPHLHTWLRSKFYYVTCVCVTKNKYITVYHLKYIQTHNDYFCFNISSTFSYVIQINQFFWNIQSLNSVSNWVTCMCFFIVTCPGEKANEGVTWVHPAAWSLHHLPQCSGM